MPASVTFSTDDKSMKQASRTRGIEKRRTRSSGIAAVDSSPDTSTPEKVPEQPKNEYQTVAANSSSPSPLPSRLSTEASSLPHRSPRSRTASRDVSPYPRTRPSTPNHSSTQSLSSSRRTSAATPAPPPRRSQRTLAKGPERPYGPPELEAALSIAIRNLESDIFAWWCANHKPGNPIPTTAYLKGRSSRIRQAAQAVDEADRLLNEAVYGKPKKKAKTGRKAAQQKSGKASSATPETSLVKFILSPQGKNKGS